MTGALGFPHVGHHQARHFQHWQGAFSVGLAPSLSDARTGARQPCKRKRSWLYELRFDVGHVLACTRSMHAYPSSQVAHRPHPSSLSTVWAGTLFLFIQNDHHYSHHMTGFGQAPWFLHELCQWKAILRRHPNDGLVRHRALPTRSWTRCSGCGARCSF